MNSFLSQVKGFTPVIDALAQELGIMPAVTYGVVWRYCQLENGVCYASLETIAKTVGVSRRTIFTHIKKLCEEGYLKDTTPAAEGVPHVYADTGKAKIFGLVEARAGMQELPTPQPEPEPMQDLPTTPAEIAHPPMQDLPTSKGSREYDNTTCADSGESDATSSGGKKPPGGYSQTHREFLGLFGSARFKNRVQVETIARLENKHGKERLMELGVWAAKNGMTVSRAVVAVEGALKKQSKNGSEQVLQVSQT